MDARYPAGKFENPKEVTPAARKAAIEEIASASAKVRAAVHGLNDEQLDTPYREGGWTVRQVVHHLADSHMNAYTRFRLALTEDEPPIKPYDEKSWAQLTDARTAPPELSLTLLEAMHARWALLLRSLVPSDFARAIKHPELGRVTLEKYLATYAWHGRHHVAHVSGLRARNGW